MKALLALLPLILIGCLPNRLVPHDFSIEKNNLEAFVEVDSITVSLVNLEIKNDHFVFGLGIQNNAAYPVFIDITKILKFASFKSFEGDTETYFPEIISAMSPTQVNQFFETKQKNAQAAAAFLFLLGAAVSTYDAVKDAKDHSKEYWTEEDEQKSVKRDAIAASTLLATDLLTEVAYASEAKATTELRYLPDELFDRKVIYPGEEYFGKLIFRKVAELQRYHRINFPLEGSQLKFDFRRATPREKQFLQENGF